ncbi:MAG: hypothetical protein K8L97_33590 [Anaerolineae bacterium]|nr:hypothetical protein [Anaerolineae bacterium]
MTRYKREFWLDARKDDELLLLETIDQLKQQRSFTATLRDGIRLIVDLRAGRLDVLFELFPFTRERLNTTPPTSGDLERRLDELQRLIVGQGGNITAPPPNYPIMKSAGAPKALNVPTTALPRFDDDEDGETVVLKKGTESSAGLNFLSAAFSLQQ